MKLLRIAACLLLLLSGTLRSFGQNSGPASKSTADKTDVAAEKKAQLAKNELWKKLSPDPSVIGVGVGESNSSPVIFVYVTRQAPKETLARIPKKCRGLTVSVVKSEPLKAE